ncbi:MAG TPA: hypothetical protein VK823_16005 [Streptosporangiaceae bacterium]|nr:hypothetical protein [Streptosporangiaceae bacterium]
MGTLKVRCTVLQLSRWQKFVSSIREKASPETSQRFHLTAICKDHIPYSKIYFPQYGIISAGPAGRSGERGLHRGRVLVAVRPGDAGGRRRRRVALYGNRIDGVDTGEQDELALENLVCAVRAAAAIDGQVLIEPVGGAARYPLLTRPTRSPSPTG